MTGSFRRDERGSIMTMTAILLPVIGMTIAGAVEYTVASNLRIAAQEIADAAALSGVTRGDETGRTIIAGSLEKLDNQSFELVRSDVSTSNDRTTASIRLRTKGIFGGTGLGLMEIEVEAVAAASQTPLDVVMALDYSGSMGTDDKYLDQAAAASALLDSFAGASAPVRAGVVPFASYALVNMDGRFLADLDAVTDLLGANYIACVANRDYPYATTIATPVLSILGSLWPATSYATTGTGLVSSTTSLVWTTTSLFGAILGGVFNLAGALIGGVLGILTGGLGGGGGGAPTHSYASSSTNAHMASETLSPDCQDYVDRNLQTQPLSSDLAALKTDIAAMTPGGATNIALALDIAWHVISDNDPWSEGAANPGAQKVAILLTDGVQTVEAQGSGGETSVSAANRNTDEICTAMKDDGVTVYTIAFDLNDAFTETLLGNCATSLAHFHKAADEADLTAAFEDIFASLNGAPRLVR